MPSMCHPAVPAQFRRHRCAEEGPCPCTASSSMESQPKHTALCIIMAFSPKQLRAGQTQTLAAKFEASVPITLPRAAFTSSSPSSHPCQPAKPLPASTPSRCPGCWLLIPFASSLVRQFTFNHVNIANRTQRSAKLTSHPLHPALSVGQ